MTTSTEPHDLVPVSVRPARFDLFGRIHKAIRLAMSELLVRMGETSFADAKASGAICQDLRELLSFCDAHLAHEEEVVAPAARERLLGGMDAFDSHGEHTRLVAELRAQIDALENAPAGLRTRVGKTLYLHFSTYVGESLVHMAEEERVIMPLLERFFDDDELRALSNAIRARATPAEVAFSGPRLLRAINPHERRALVYDAAQTMPRGSALRLLGGLRGRLPDGELDELVAIAEAANAGGR